ncbi:MAG: hypothetical protein EXS51_03010 [Candidatus Taylorbacteria bacterium]|nr:hypothetical protein [Candidatus Taylorbacteria bacterium]
MKRFVLKFEMRNRTHPGQVVIDIVAENEQAARELASHQDTECPSNAWLDAAKTSCGSHRTRRKNREVLSVGRH